MTLDQGAFRHTMGQFASGVTVVTTMDGEQPVGITVSSFTSLSLDPPLVLVCIDRRGRSHAALLASKQFAVHILAEDQEQIARIFASRAEDKFAGVAFGVSAHGLPVLEDTLATVECRLVNALPGGDHTIFVGEVIALETTAGRPLVYHGARFGQFEPFPPAEDRALDTTTARPAGAPYACTVAGVPSTG